MRQSTAAPYRQSGTAPCLATRAPFGLPQPEAAGERVLVGATARVGRQLVEVPHAAAADHDVVGLHCGLEARHDVEQRLGPFLLPSPLVRLLADVVLERLLAIRQMSELERLDDAVHDQRGAEPRAES